MNSWQNDRTLDESIDLLVDDELSEHEFHELIRELDVAEDGWRRCALAFLEEREWTRVVGKAPFAEESRLAFASRETRADVMAGSSADLPATTNNSMLRNSVSRNPVSRKPASGKPASGKSASSGAKPSNSELATGGSGIFWWFAIAAAVAFLVGRSSVVPDVSPHGESLTTEDRRSAAEGIDHLAKGDDSHSMASGRIYPTSLLVEGDDDQPRFELPVADFGGQATDWTRQPPPIPRGVEQAIQRMGGEIEREYFFAPAELENGQHVVVPVEKLHIRPASHRRVY